MHSFLRTIGFSDGHINEYEINILLDEICRQYDHMVSVMGKQANAAFNRCIYYEAAADSEDQPGKTDDAAGGLYVCQYFDSDYSGTIAGAQVSIRQRTNPLNGSEHLSSDSSGVQRINEICPTVPHNPRRLVVDLEVKSQGGNPLAIHVRIQAWAKSAQVLVNGIPAAEEAVPGTFLTLEEADDDSFFHIGLPVSWSEFSMISAYHKLTENQPIFPSSFSSC